MLQKIKVKHATIKNKHFFIPFLYFVVSYSQNYEHILQKKSPTTALIIAGLRKEICKHLLRSLPIILVDTIFDFGRFHFTLD